jgi:hypothetical protein
MAKEDPLHGIEKIEVNQCDINHVMLSLDEPLYPYNEGDSYWTLEGKNSLIRSCWDDVSEYQFREDKIYFDNLEDGIRFMMSQKINKIKVYDYASKCYEIKINRLFT